MSKKRVDKGVPGMELLVCRNPKAAKRYEIEETIECGMVLQGSEVKSLRQRRADLEGSYADVHDGELFLHKMHIAPYEQGGKHNNHEPKRSRKLLAHKREIEKLRGRLTTRGYTLVPLQVYFKNGVAKIQLGLGKGKKLHDDRESIRRKQDLREARDAMRRR
ncbi:MAG TPA: SsrA-binding protein SmpB [Polyangiaceae bacterium LLY-WYZ-15_(1-7)]|nr:SsrA-binding protein SmpB [Polyangiaceae bacterium LLY-WYZ-15_(1-7)]HJL03489.1 SsrA-binding protein SmpB [Polyangiaceae bacterium LLY-WYZ-15_(1-7)]HJL09604.1 SsrA-binding protein SmpB [Polyangiaceae bacterium LLY-WYZ-15_(1-7)]HJL37247.1 SsrA-binding protein SmpB [Polyangiaceae bacterium LLY-WYZ-15_(1-7)]HJL50794.1 SsrA-binding protein SmpB [Polyangiaceae bacterium LLY-WYZ-15_(1-7)]